MTNIQFPDLVALGYEVAGHTDGLAKLMQATADFFNTQESAVTIWSPKNPASFLPVTHGMASNELQDLFDQRGQTGSLFEKLNRLAGGETFVIKASGQTRAPGGLRSRTDTMHLLAGLVSADGDNRCAILLFREPQNSEFNPLEEQTLQNLMRYFQRAEKLNRQFRQTFLEHRTAFTVLESSPQGIFFLGQKGQVTYQNVEARMLFSIKDGLRLRNGSVHIDDSEVRKELDTYVNQMRSSTATDSEANLACAIPRKSNSAPYQLIISKLPFEAQRAALNEDESLAMAVISDPEDMGELKVELLRTFFGLSAAEARLARALYKFHVLSDAAAALGISIHTARSELKKIFKKLEVKSQPALLKKLAKAIRHT